MLSGIFYVAATIAFTVYGQLILKWQMNHVGLLPSDTLAKVEFLLSMLYRPWILTAFAAAFLASLAWMAAMTKFKLSEAYPFTSLAFVLVMISSCFLFGEELTANKIAGTAIVISGLIVIAW
jgi:multidrug transporter EmrE-like cation transporter